MKKYLFVFALFICSNSIAFSLSETWFSLGFEYGILFERAINERRAVNSYIGSPGFNLNFYQFWNGMNAGLFVHGFGGIPSVLSYEMSSEVQENTDLEVYFTGGQFGLIIGPGFRYSFTEKLKLQFGFGLMLMASIYDFVDSSLIVLNINYTITVFSLGVGGDIGIKYDITDVVYLSIGSILAHDFPHPSMNPLFYDAYDKSYTAFSMRPYLRVGFNLYNEGRHFGKPRP